MITDDAAIKKLAFRSDLPRLSKEGFHLFAQLETEEQKLGDHEKAQLLAGAFAALVAREEQMSDRPLPAILPRAYQRKETSPEWVEIEYACDLAEPFERRNRAGEVLAVTRHLKGRVRLHRGAFAYFAGDDLRPLETVSTEGFTILER